MFRNLLVGFAFSLVLPAIAMAEDQIHFGDYAVTTPEGYGIRTRGGSLAIVDDVRGITVELYRFEKLRAPTKQAVTSVLLRYKDTDDVVVQRVEAGQQHGAKCVYAEGTATIDDAKSRFWFLSMDGRGRVMTAVAHAAADLDPASVTEIEFIIDSVRRDKKASGIKVQDFFDFETPQLSNRWIAQGPLTVERKVPDRPFKPSDAAGRGGASARLPKRHAVRLKTDGQGGFFTKAALVPEDWTKFESVSFWVLRDGSAERPTTVELQVMEPDTRVKFWRKVVVDHDGWKRYTIPLRWMRWGNLGVPSWNNIDRIGIWFRDQGDLWIDSIALEDLDAARGAALTAADVLPIACPEGNQNAKVLTNDAVSIIANSADLDVDQLAAHLQQVKQAIQADLSCLALDDTSHLPSVVIAPTRQAYLKFATDFAAAMNSQIAGPSSHGLTFQGLAMSYWEPQWGTLRPVYTHEYVHAALSTALDFSNRGEWLHEGLAVYYQLKYHPQENFNQIVQEGLVRPGYSTPLAQLCNGNAIRKNRYWQAMSVIDMLLTHEDYRRRLPKFFETVRSTSSTDLNPILTPVFDKSWKEFTDDWRAHGRTKFRVEGDRKAAGAG